MPDGKFRSDWPFTIYSVYRKRPVVRALAFKEHGLGSVLDGCHM